MKVYDISPGNIRLEVDLKVRGPLTYTTS